MKDYHINILYSEERKLRTSIIKSIRGNKNLDKSKFLFPQIL